MSRPAALTLTALKSHPLPAIEDGDKHDHGRLLVVAGSRDLAGAPLLAGLAAMRAGTGNLKLATVSSIASQLGVAMPEAMVVSLAEARDGGFARSAMATIADLANEVDVVLAGPGMLPNNMSERLGATLSDRASALIFDAAMLHVLRRRSVARPPLVLLPHSGEMAALLECSEEQVEADPVAAGRECAEAYCATVLVKGASSHVVSSDGRVWKYSGGCPGLGVSGSGDVLAGIVGGLIARGAEPVTALLWAVWLHGEAGTALARKMGDIGFLARELPAEIPRLLQKAQASFE
jgi:ADP-dependent NAD(P)H-hydrate dehydratase